MYLKIFWKRIFSPPFPQGSKNPCRYIEKVLFINYWKIKWTTGSPLIPSCKIFKDKRPENIAQNCKGR